MSLIKFAKAELELAGLFDKDSDFGIAVMELIKVFSKQGHSGLSANQTLALFDKAARFKPLTPLTFKDDEWLEIGKVFQNNRRIKRRP